MARKPGKPNTGQDRPVESPFRLLQAEVKVFDAVIAARERSTWSPADIEVAAHLARLTVEMRKVWRQYKKQGPTVMGAKGVVVNPTLRSYTTLTQMYHSYRTALGLSAAQRDLSGHRQSKRNKQDSDARMTLAGVNDLFAKPGD